MKYERNMIPVLVLALTIPLFSTLADVIPTGVPGTLKVLGKCLEVSPYRHETVQLDDCTESPNQQFTFNENGSISSQGWCLDIPNSYATDHQVIQLFDCRDQLNQKFVTDNQNHLSVLGKCLDVPNSDPSDGVKMQLFDCRYQENQSIQFYPQN
jgi:hypothetical protein